MFVLVFAPFRTKEKPKQNKTLKKIALPGLFGFRDT